MSKFHTLCRSQNTECKLPYMEIRAVGNMWLRMFSQICFSCFTVFSALKNEGCCICISLDKSFQSLSNIPKSCKRPIIWSINFFKLFFWLTFCGHIMFSSWDSRSVFSLQLLTTATLLVWQQSAENVSGAEIKKNKQNYFLGFRATLVCETNKLPDLFMT